MSPTVILILLIIILAAAAGSIPAPSKSVVEILLLGDWGGSPDPPYYTTAQMQTASGMNKIAANVGASAVLALGDNFYYSGVVDVESTRFDNTFNNVYNGPYLATLPWYAILGNHDYGGNVSAQIDYSNRNTRWNMPSVYYTKNFSSLDGTITIDFIMIDTVALDMLPSSASAQVQLNWIEQELNKSTASYIVVVGHYPVYSICSHGNTPSLITYLEPLLSKYKAIYASGHDHCQEYLINNNVNYIVSGIGMMCCYSADNLANNPVQQVKWYVSSETVTNNVIYSSVVGGFAKISASNTSLVVTYFDQNGNTLYTTPKIAPRTCTINCSSPSDPSPPTTSPTKISSPLSSSLGGPILSGGVIAGIVIGSVSIVAILVYLVFKLILPNLTGGKAVIGGSSSVESSTSTNPM